MWEHRFELFRDREWVWRADCADCAMFRYCLGGGMHLRDNNGKLLVCHYRRITEK